MHGVEEAAGARAALVVGLFFLYARVDCVSPRPAQVDDSVFFFRHIMIGLTWVEGVKDGWVNEPSMVPVC